MTSSVLYLFPDTNLFIQCKSLEELDWSVWNSFDELHLIVSRPVQREIDSQKNKGNNRIGRRARAASSTFREIILGDDDYRLIRDKEPIVKLFLKPEYRHSEILADRLNYEERDDQLVGTIFEFTQANPEADVRLLTHDTMPLATAKSVGMKAEPILDEWLLPPETDKKTAALQAEIKKLKKTEPSFRIYCVNDADIVIEKIEHVYTIYEPLTDTEIDALMHQLKQRCPLETEFGSSQPAIREAQIGKIRFRGIEQKFVPATEQQITSYNNETYPNWLNRCQETLRRCHLDFQRENKTPCFSFLASNDGTRPAKDALITIETNGDFAIMPPRRRLRDDKAQNESGGQNWKELVLPNPPAAPRGNWETALSSNMAAISKIGRSLVDPMARVSGYGFDPLAGTFGHFGSTITDPNIFLPQKHDPNAFFYKPERPVVPQGAFSLECDQWRHSDGEQSFKGQIHFATDKQAIEGLLVCRIQAENLSQTIEERVPVRITVTSTSAYEKASELVDAVFV